MTKNLTFTSTRNGSLEERINFKNFDINKEFHKLRTMSAVLLKKSDKLSSDVKFVIEAFSNIDEYINQFGKLPESWERAQKLRKEIKLKMNFFMPNNQNLFSKLLKRC